nr:MAG: RNA-dependent RNA polymerase [Mitovirus sp.]
MVRGLRPKEYAGIMTSLDVGIGAHKSLISTTGKAMEFAKRTFLNGVNVSMVPFAEFVVGRQSLAGLLELTRKYSLSFGQMLSVLGYGYRAKASASKRLFSLPKRLRNYIVTFYGPGGPGYKGLKGWLPLKSVTSLYKTSVTRVHGLCKLFFESEIRLILEYLDSYSDLIAALMGSGDDRKLSRSIMLLLSERGLWTGPLIRDPGRMPPKCQKTHFGYQPLPLNLFPRHRPSNRHRRGWT